jgi:hypothetical protein
MTANPATKRMPSPNTYTVAGVTYVPNVPPEDVASACEALLCAFARREISDLDILQEWHRQMPAWVAIPGQGDPDAVGKWALGQFHWAGLEKDRPRLHLLIAAGLHHVGCLSDGVSALRVLAEAKWPQGIADFVEYGGDVGINRRNFWGSATILTSCVLGGPVELIPLLLANGADPDVQDSDGWTSLHHAANSAGGALVTVKLLVAAGASLRTRTPEGKTALDQARKRQNESVIRFLAGRMDEPT